MNQKIRKISSKHIFKSKWYNLDHDKIILPNKKKADYFVVRTKGSVMIIPITSDNKIILTKQLRYTSGKYSIELPAGGMKTNNSRKEAKKELEEETGYKTKLLKKIGQFYPYNGISSEICHVYLAKDLVKTKQNLDDTEFIKITKMTINQVYKLIKNNKITDGMTLASLNLAKEHLKTIA